MDPPPYSFRTVEDGDDRLDHGRTYAEDVALHTLSRRSAVLLLAIGAVLQAHPLNRPCTYKDMPRLNYGNEPA